MKANALRVTALCSVFCWMMCFVGCKHSSSTQAKAASGALSLNTAGYAKLVDDEPRQPDPEAQKKLCERFDDGAGAPEPEEGAPDSCARHCDAWPASTACHLYWKSGQEGVEVASHLVVMGADDDPVARAIAYGLSEDEADRLVLFLADEGEMVDYRYTPRAANAEARETFRMRVQECGGFEATEPTESKRATSCMEPLLSEAEASFGPESYEALWVRDSLIRYAGDLGLREQQARLLEESRALLDQRYPAHHPLRISFDLQLGFRLAFARDPSEQERGIALMKDAIERAEMIWGKHHPAIASFLETYGVVNLRAHSRVARDAIERSFAIRLENFGPKSREVGRSALFVGEVVYQLGDYGAAFAAFAFAIEIYKSDKPRSLELGIGLQGLARSLFKRGETEQSEQLLLIAFQIFRERGDTSLMADTIGYLGRVYLFKKDYRAAREIFEKARELHTALEGKDSEAVSNVDFNIGITSHLLGEHERARDELLMAIAKREALGIDTRDERGSLADVYLALGDHERALSESLPALKSSQTEFFASLLTAKNELQVLELIARLQVTGESVYSLLGDSPEHRDLAAQIILDWKGASQWAERMRRDVNAVREALPQERRPEFDAFLQKRVMLGLLERARDTEATKKATLEEEIAREFASLLAHPALREFTLDLPPSVADVCERVNRSERTLVIFGDIDKTVYDESTPLKYVIRAEYDAIVFAPGKCSPLRVPLGQAKALDKEIDAWRVTVEKSEACYQKRGSASKCLKAFARQHQAGATLYQKLWEPIEARVKTNSVWLTTEGRLDEVAFDTLVDKKDRHLLEKRELRSLPYPGAVVHLKESETSTSGALVLGDLDYDRVASGEALAASWQRCDSSGCRDADEVGGSTVVASRGGAACGYDVSWGSLGATEAKPVASHLGVVLSGEGSTLVTGDGAGEAQVREAMRGKRVVHLATHGFFASDPECESFARQGTDAFGLGAGMASLRVDPLKLSAVVLSGANKEKDGVDGILTAREVANTDLSGTELVVLSACETGRGKVHEAGGAQGLGQAFMMAGVENTIVSLWRVPSAPTRDLFIDFYQRAYGKKAPVHPQVALREAKLAMLKKSRAEGVIYSEFLWGAFVAQSLQSD